MLKAGIFGGFGSCFSHQIYLLSALSADVCRVAGRRISKSFAPRPHAVNQLLPLLQRRKVEPPDRLPVRELVW